MKTNKIIATIAILAFLAAGYGLMSGGKVIVQERVGAVSTLDGVDFPFYSIGGVRYFNYAQGITATSSVICSTRISATSTLETASVFAASSPFIAAQAIDISTSTTQYGSSTPAFVSSWPAPAALGFSLVYNGESTSTTAKLIGLTPQGSGTLGQSGASDNVIYPGQYVNVRLASTTPGTFTSYLPGSCKMVFREISR